MNPETDNKSFLEKLQSADEDTKRRWLVAGTIVCVVVVVYVWLGYFNNLVSSSAESAAAQVPETGFSFWASAKGGAALLYNFLNDGAHTLGNVLSAPREYIIQPPIR